MSSQFILDRTGFPMIWVDVVDAYVHWLPVTKQQFETFICDKPSPQFNENKYREIMEPNPRISPIYIKDDNYWQAFLTNIYPKEAILFTEWCGDAYHIPTLEEWNKAYQYLKLEPAVQQLMDHFSMSEISANLIKRLDKVVKDSYVNEISNLNCALQMFMRFGVMEWVRNPTIRKEWGGMGQTDRHLQSMIQTPDSGIAELPKDPENFRMRYYGFRLFKGK